MRLCRRTPGLLPRRRVAGPERGTPAPRAEGARPSRFIFHGSGVSFVSLRNAHVHFVRFEGNRPVISSGERSSVSSAPRLARGVLCLCVRGSAPTTGWRRTIGRKNEREARRQTQSWLVAQPSAGPRNGSSTPERQTISDKRGVRAACLPACHCTKLTAKCGLGSGRVCPMWMHFLANASLR